MILSLHDFKLKHPIMPTHTRTRTRTLTQTLMKALPVKE